MTTAIQVGIGGVGQIAIRATDLDRSIVFYRDVLGLPLLMEIPGAAFFDCGGVRLMLTKPESSEYDHPGSIIYYRVTDIQAAALEMERRGAQLLGEPHLIARMPDHELWMVFLKDPSANTLALMAEVKPAS